MEKINNTELGLFTNYMRDRGLCESTVQIYTAVVRRFLATNPDVHSLESYNNFLIRYAVKKSQYNYPYALKKFMEYYIEDTKLKNEIIKGLIIRPLKDKQRDGARLTEQQINKVINNLTLDKYKLIAKIQVETGVRVNDVISGLTIKNMHEDTEDGKRVLRLRLQTKGRKMITTYIQNQNLIDELLDYSKKYAERIIIPEENIDDVFVFLKLPKKFIATERRNSFQLSQNMYNSYWTNLKRALTACNIPLQDWSTHDFRRNFARKLYKESGHDFELLKQSLNHVRSDTTIKYIKSDPSEVREMIRRVQVKMEKALENKKLIVLTNDYIEGFKIGDEVPQVGLNDPDIDDMILTGVENGHLKYV